MIKHCFSKWARAFEGTEEPTPKNAFDYVERAKSRVFIEEQSTTTISSMGGQFSDNLNQFTEAFNLTDRSKSRQLLDLLAEKLSQTGKKISQTTIKNERYLFTQWINAIRTVKAFDPEASNHATYTEFYQASQNVNRIRDPEYVSLRRGSPLRFNEVLSILTNL